MKRRFFTLLEILLVFALVAAVAGVLALQGARMVREQRFHSSVEELLDLLRFSQEIMLLHNRDVTLSFFLLEQEVSLTLSVDRKLSGPLGRLISKPKRLGGIDSILFENPSGETYRLPLALQFKAAGLQTPKGVLSLFQGGLSKKISLPGYPAPLEFGERPLEDFEEEPYPEELRALWRSSREGS